MFDVGQKVICVRKETWVCGNKPWKSHGPAYLTECVVAEFIPEDSELPFGAFAGEDGLRLIGWLKAVYAARYFRPKEPDIEALWGLVTKVPAKMPEEV